MDKTVSLFLMTQKGLSVLEKLIEHNLDGFIDKVIVGKDKSVTNDYSNEIIRILEENKILWYERNSDYIINSEYSIAISWRWMIDLSESESRLIVLHDSLLPKYRGFAPLVNMLINGEERIGVTALFASESFDQGEILLQESIAVNYPVKIHDAIGSVSKLYSSIVVELLNKLNKEKTLKGVEQDEGEATFSVWRDEEDYRIDWNDSSTDILRSVNSLGEPYLGASAMLDGRLIRVYETVNYKPTVIEKSKSQGKVLFIEDGKPVVVCGSGLLKICEAVYDDTKESILPLKKYRTRFK